MMTIPDSQCRFSVMSGFRSTRWTSPSSATPCSISKASGSVQTTTCLWSPSPTGWPPKPPRPLNWSFLRLSLHRFVFLKYADRGLVNDRFYYNMNMSLFNVLFWISNITLFMFNQGNMWVHIFIHGKSPFENTYRYWSILYCILYYIARYFRSLLCKMVQTPEDSMPSHTFLEVELRVYQYDHLETFNQK